MRTGEAFYPDHAPGHHRVPLRCLYVAQERSSSQPDLVHTVRRLGDGSWRCTCLGFDYGHVCKHIKKHRLIAARPPAVLPGMFYPSYS